MSKIEKKIIEFIEKNIVVLILGLITILALYARYKMLNFQSGDYDLFLSPWFNYLKDNGGLKALKDFPGDYNAPYMTIIALLTYIPLKSIYLIKSISIISDFVLAILSSKLVSLLVDKNKKWLQYFTYIVILFLPQVLLNGAFWGQCDSLYACFCILSLIFLINEKYTKSFISLGFAFAFKLQFIFILPIFIIIYISKKKFSIINFLIIPITNFVLCLPAIIMGKPFLDCLTIYFKQTDTYADSLQLNFLNIYQIISNYSDFIRPVGMIVTLVICITVLFYVIEKKIKWNNEKIITLSLWFLVVVTFTLPCMHERYLFVGEILSIIYYISYRKNGILVSIININAIITYSSFLFGNSAVGWQLLPYIYILVILNFTKNTFKLLDDSNTE